MSWSLIWSWYLSSKSKLCGFSLKSTLDKFIYCVWFPSMFMIFNSGMLNLLSEVMLVMWLLIRKRSLNFGESRNTVNSILLISVWLMRMDLRLINECITMYLVRFVVMYREGFSLAWPNKFFSFDYRLLFSCPCWLLLHTIRC